MENRILPIFRNKHKWMLVSKECCCSNFVGLTFRRTQSEKGRVITTSSQDIMNSNQPQTPIPPLELELLSSEQHKFQLFTTKIKYITQALMSIHQLLLGKVFKESYTYQFQTMFGLYCLCQSRSSSQFIVVNSGNIEDCITPSALCPVRPASSPL